MILPGGDLKVDGGFFEVCLLVQLIYVHTFGAEWLVVG